MDPTQIGITTPPRQIDPNSPYLMDFNQRDFSELSQLYQDGRVSEIELVSKLAKVASDNPTIKAHLEPILRQAAEVWREELDAFKTASHFYPKVITHKKWASMTGFEKLAVVRKLAHQPLLKSEGLTKDAVRDGTAFMVYKVDPASNNSKFYEGVIVPEAGGFKVVRRWGALTDSGETGRVDGGKHDRDPRFWFRDLGSAKRELNEHYSKRISHGYVDAFGSKHRTPDGHTLPMGQYPVGLARSVGFGWGSQSVTQCIPGLRQLEDALTQARDEIQATTRSDAVKTHLETSLSLIKTVSHADSSMGQKLIGLLSKPFRRVSGSPRFLPDPEGRALAAELFTIINYVHKQLSLCH